MHTLFQLLLLILLLLNFALLIASKMPLRIRLVALQGAALSGLLLCMPRHPGTGIAHLVWLALAVFLIKAVGFPWLLGRTVRKVQISEHVHPYIGRTLSAIIGTVALLFSLWLESRLPLAQGASEMYPPLLFPVGLTTLFAGLTLVAGRTRAIAQVMGYLVAENGIFILSMPLLMGGSTWFELTLLLDVFVAVFVMGIAINHISEAFDSQDVERFSSLHD